MLTTAAWQTVAAHPPGEAGWIALAQLLTRLPLGSIPFRLGLLSLLSVAGSALLLHRLGTVFIQAPQPARAREVSGQLWAIALAPMLSFPVWIQAVRVEVYGLSLLMTLAMLERVFASGLLDSGQKPLDMRRLWQAALVGGLGLSVHPLLVGLAGLPIVLIMGLDRRTWRLPCWTGASLAGILGVSGVLLLPLRSQRHPDLGWGEAGRWSGFWDILLARTFQQNFGPQDGRMWTDNLWVLSRVFPPGLMLLALVGLFGLFWQRRTRLGMFLGLVLVTNLGSVLSQNVVIEHNPDLHGYLMLTHCVGWLLAGLALTWGLTHLRRGFNALAPGGLLIRVLPWLPPATVAVLVLPPLLLAWPALDRGDDTLARAHGLAALERLPPGAHLVLSGNDSTFILQYLQAVEGRRPDVTVLPRALLTHPWFRARLGWSKAQADAVVQGGNLTQVLASTPFRVELREQDLVEAERLCPVPTPGWGFYAPGTCAWKTPSEGTGALAAGLLHMPGVARGPQALAVGWLASSLWVKFLSARGYEAQARVEAAAQDHLLSTLLEGLEPAQAEFSHPSAP